MWIYRLGLARAKYYALTGEWVSGKQAADMELINFSYPLEELDDRATALAEKLAKIPLTQLAAMKLIVNQATTIWVCRARKYSDRSSTEPCAIRRRPRFRAARPREGVKSAVTGRDGPFGDYSQGPAEDQPRKRSQLPQDGTTRATGA